MIKMHLCSFLAVGVLFTSTAWASQILTLDPAGGAVTGLAGSTVGWGFTFTNTDGDFAVLDQSQFCNAASAVPDVCDPVAPDLGIYNDFILAQGPIAGSSLSETYDGSSMGIGSFAIDPSASGTVSGIILVTFDEYSVSPNDPSFDPVVDFISSGDFVTAAASVTVGTVTPTPEPGLLPLLIAGLLLAIALQSRGSRKASGAS